MFWAIAGAFVLVLLGLTFFGGQEEDAAGTRGPVEDFDAFAGGYPVPPMGDQVLPELAGVLSVPPEDEADPTDQSQPRPAPTGAHTTTTENEAGS